MTAGSYRFPKTIRNFILLPHTTVVFSFFFQFFNPIENMYFQFFSNALIALQGRLTWVLGRPIFSSLRGLRSDF